MIATRIVRFGATGVITTLVTYLGFAALIRLGWHYLPAGVASWGGGVATSFVLHRRFTFGIKGAERQGRDFGAYVGGALLQLALGLAGYELLIGHLRLPTTPAFIINLVATSGFSFLFMSLVTFRRVGTFGFINAPFAAPKPGRDP